MDRWLIKVNTWTVDPYREGIRWLCYAVRGIMMALCGITCPLRGNYGSSKWLPWRCSETFQSRWEWSLKDENDMICRSQGITYKKHRTEMSDSTLHCHHHLNKSQIHTGSDKQQQAAQEPQKVSDIQRLQVTAGDITCGDTRRAGPELLNQQLKIKMKKTTD